MVRVVIWGVMLTFCIGFAQENGRDKSRHYPLNLSSDLQWQSAQDAGSVETKTYGRKDRGAAFRKSILIPGWGQITTGREIRGYIFLGAEVVLIAGYFGYRQHSAWLKDDYTTYANQHAGITGAHPHQFYVDIGNWMNRELYNEQRIRDRDFESVYTNPDDDWSWDSDANRAGFKSMRISSDKAKQLAVFMIGGLILNHLASAIDATHLPLEESTVSVMPTEKGDGLMVGIVVR